MKIKKILCVVALLMATCVTLWANNDGMLVGLYITEAKSGKVVAEENSDICLTPASITKLITTATALEILGPDFRFKTELAYDGTISNGVLDGNLYIIGGGDPTLGSTYLKNSGFLAQWVAAVKALGIRSIAGSVVADATIFDRMPIPPGWFWEDLGNYYAAGVFGLSVYDNTMTLTLNTQQTGRKPTIVSMSPKIPDMVLENNLISEGNSDEGYFYGMPYSNYRMVMGTVPSGKKAFSLRGDIPNPPMLLAHQLTDALKNGGITVRQAPKDQPIGKEKRIVVCTTESPTLKEIIKETNYRSLNHYAEHLLKYLALERQKTATLNKSLEVVKHYWSVRGVETRNMFMLDGSGLSAHAAITPKVFNEVLRYMYNKSENRDFFIQSLPVAGESGTVKSLFKNTPLEKRAHLKSGSMSRVQCYSGYVDYNDKIYIVTVMVNNFDVERSKVRSMIEERVIKAIVKQ